MKIFYVETTTTSILTFFGHPEADLRTPPTSCQFARRASKIRSACTGPSLPPEKSLYKIPLNDGTVIYLEPHKMG